MSVHEDNEDGVHQEVDEDRVHQEVDEDGVQQQELANTLNTTDQTTSIGVKKDVLKTRTRTIVPPPRYRT